ncbi:8-amino-7-oxononanoate synthase [Shewanella xiamenensis]|nr:8-amino-7-oxononanoate synthase [Shewanella xiamenensis]
MIWAERFFIDIFKLTYAAGNQNGLKSGLEARQDIGEHRALLTGL